jgi:hypothetical protein
MLVAPGENLVQRRDRLPARGIGGAVEQHLDLRVVTRGGVIGHPAAGLEVEVLQIVGRALAFRVLVQHLAAPAAFAATVNVGQIRKKQARAVEQGEQRAVAVGGQGIDSGFDVREILRE